MRLRRKLLVVIGLAFCAISDSAFAQSACVTPNCVYGDVPDVCRRRAAPRTSTVLLGNGGTLTFLPSEPRIEPGDCIRWLTVSSIHDSSEAACPDDLTCGSVSPPECRWNSGNLDSMSALPASTCFYDPTAFPAGTGDAYYCRRHASPTSGTMRGTLRVTTSIALAADKDSGTGSVKLTWSGGGVTGDLSYKIARQAGGDPAFPAGTTTTVNPDGGVFGTTFLDAGALGSPNSIYYLVRNKQTNEP
jgi:plastocyanin